MYYFLYFVALRNKNISHLILAMLHQWGQRKASAVREGWP